MIKSYGIPGESQETRTELDIGAPYILMKSDRTEPHYVATESGEWVEPKDLREFKHYEVREFFKLFEPERVEIKTAAMSDPVVGIWYDDALSAKYITYSDPDTVAGLEALVQFGLLTEARHQEIITVMTAEKQP